MIPKNVYLAGGFKSGWQNIVKECCEHYSYFDPSSHNIVNPKEYTEFDLKAVREADIVFAYMEVSNPAGYALALEIGYAKALGKLIIFVEEGLENPRKRYFDMVRYSSDFNFTSLQDGIEYLQKLENF
ncbi:nucleoside 2-deoxyribosyltransferase domain-containing protein [Aliiglaciecola sp. NS0011-25]|uniref:nucleoside 2-deoxyribosyltransferase domain-containing protein n=1 Tax=Aliiglaciecola sp. NS0011-25 TaxID=3127654 RepID=UPI0031085994